ncbi:MAG: recombinase family protein [Armatimonadota bacterium]
MEKELASRASRNSLRLTSYQQTTRFMNRVASLLAEMNPDPFIMLDCPDGFGYRRLSMNTFYVANLFPVDEDEPGLTIPWPPNEVQTVVRIFHLAATEHQPPEEIAAYLIAHDETADPTHWSAETVNSILTDETYTQIGIIEFGAPGEPERRLTPVTSELFAAAQGSVAQG